jgi:UrcA family protein
MQKTILAVAALFVFSGVANVVEAREIRVSIADTNMANSESVAKLYNKLERAAARVCASESVFNQVSAKRQRACMENVLQATVASADNTYLTAHFEQRRPQVVLASR